MMSGDSQTPEELKSYVEQPQMFRVQNWKNLNFVIVSKQTSKIIGLIKLSKPSFLYKIFLRSRRAASQESEKGWAWIQYSLIPDQWGNGIMSEVVPAVLKNGNAHMGISNVFTQALISNVGSQKVLTKAGFKKVYETPERTYFEWTQTND